MGYIIKTPSCPDDHCHLCGTKEKHIEAFKYGYDHARPNYLSICSDCKKKLGNVLLGK